MGQNGKNMTAKQKVIILELLSKVFKEEVDLIDFCRRWYNFTPFIDFETKNPLQPMTFRTLTIFSEQKLIDENFFKRLRLLTKDNYLLGEINNLEKEFIGLR